jgi:hypothetical protein
MADSLTKTTDLRGITQIHELRYNDSSRNLDLLSVLEVELSRRVFKNDGCLSFTPGMVIDSATRNQ